MAEFHDEQTETLYFKSVSSTTLMTLRVIMNYIISDIAKRPRSFKIGLFATYIVITFLGLLQCVVQLSPLIFLQLAETSTGDTDLQILPIAAENTTNFQLINITNLRDHVNLVPQFLGVSPRWLLMCNLHNTKQNFKSYFMILDSQLENSIGVGRRLDTDIISGREVYVSDTALRGLNISVGEMININIDLKQILRNFGLGEENGEMLIELRNQLKHLVNRYLQEFKISKYQYNVSELQQVAREYQTYVQGIEITSFTKSLAHEFVKRQVKQNITEPALQEFALEVVDFAFARNMTRDAMSINNFLDRVALFSPVLKISDVVDGVFDLAIQSSSFDIKGQVHGGIESPKGKWADALGMMAYMDYRNATNIFLEAYFDRLQVVVKENQQSNKGMAGALTELIQVNDTREWGREATKDFDITQYALLGNLMFKNRGVNYETPETIKNSIIESSNTFFSEAGYNYPIQITAPLGMVIKVYHLMKNFIENLLGVATMILLMLSILLIYSLMIGDVEEKTYEFGMLRALGFRKSWLIILLLLQALTFAIPGLLLGLVTCYLLNSIVSMYIFDMTLLYTSYAIPTTALFFQVCLGISMPIISNILPIKKALSKALRDSLDLFHRVVNDFLVTVEKLERMGISTSQSFCAALLISMGFVSYYVIPMNIIFQNLRGAIIVINIIFITMVVGVTVLMNLFEQILERGVLKLILFIRLQDRNLKTIILNNLHGHQNRNYKTTLMYSLGLAFIIFTGAQFALQTEFMSDFIKTSLTSDIIIFDASIQALGLDEYKFRQHLEQEMIDDPTFIYGYTFSAISLTDIPGIPKHFQISPLSHFPKRRIRLHGIEQNYLHIINNQYYYPTEYDSKQKQIKYLNNGLRDGVYDLYNREGNIDITLTSDTHKILANSELQQSFRELHKELHQDAQKREFIDREINIIIPEGYRYEDGVDVDTPALLRIWFQVGRRAIEKRLKIKHMAQKIPNNDFSAYRTVALYGEGLITMEDQQMLINELLNSNIIDNRFSNYRAFIYFQNLPKNLTYGLPKDLLLIKFNRTTTKEERIDFSNRLRNYFTNDQIYLFDSITMIETSKDFFNYLDLFNEIVAAIALILSFFLLLVSFIGNVRNNSWEIGVLRAIGLSENQIVRVFVYEAVSLITASGLIGTIIGLVIATTFTFQIVAFSEFKFKFAFPTQLFTITFIGGTLIAVYASILAIKSFKKNSIASILKGQS